MSRRTLFVVCASLLLTAITGTAAAQNTLDEIIVTAVPRNDPTEIAPDAAAVLSVAGELGDPLKAILVFPGITFGGGDLEPPVIRGGGPGDNQFFVDDIPLANVFHIYTNSIISGDVVRTFDLYTNAAPVRFSGGVGGVVDIGLRDPKRDRLHATLDIGQFISGALIEGPLTDSVSGYVSVRENLSRVLLKNLTGDSDDKLPASRDYTTRLAWHGRDHQLTFTALGAYDGPGQSAEPDEEPAFGDDRASRLNAASLRWDTVFGNDTRFRSTAAWVNEKTTALNETGRLVDAEVDVETQSWRNLMQTSGDPWSFDLGANWQRDVAAVSGPTRITARDTFDSVDLFGNLRWQVGPLTQTEFGAVYWQDGYNKSSGFDPRIGVSQTLRPNEMLFVRAGVTHQRPALADLINQGASARGIERNRAREVSLGYRRQFGSGWSLQTELYHKTLSTTDFDFDLNVDRRDPTPLDGEVRGVDVLVARTPRKGLHGFLALSLSDNRRDNPATGETFDYVFSTPVSATVALNYTGDKWRIGAKYRYQSGQPFTPAAGIDLSSGLTDPADRILYGPRFSQRGDDYQRLDVRIERQLGWRFAEASAYLDLLNITARDNTYDQTPRELILGPTGQPIAVDPDAGSAAVPTFIALGLRLRF
ncbi:MAG: hypothetical protein AAFV30_00230 [Pseudomonadota bacterium]